MFIKIKILVAVVGAIGIIVTTFLASHHFITSASHPERRDFTFTVGQVHSQQISFRPMRGNIVGTMHQVNGRVPVTYTVRRAQNTETLQSIRTVTFNRNSYHNNISFPIGTQNAATTNNFRLDFVRSNVQNTTPATGAAATLRLFVFISGQ